MPKPFYINGNNSTGNIFSEKKPRTNTRTGTNRTISTVHQTTNKYQNWDSPNHFDSTPDDKQIPELGLTEPFRPHTRRQTNTRTGTHRTISTAHQTTNKYQNWDSRNHFDSTPDDKQIPELGLTEPFRPHTRRQTNTRTGTHRTISTAHHTTNKYQYWDSPNHFDSTPDDKQIPELGLTEPFRQHTRRQTNTRTGTHRTISTAHQTTNRYQNWDSPNHFDSTPDDKQIPEVGLTEPFRPHTRRQTNTRSGTHRTISTAHQTTNRYQNWDSPNHFDRTPDDKQIPELGLTEPFRPHTRRQTNTRTGTHRTISTAHQTTNRYQNWDSPNHFDRTPDDKQIPELGLTEPFRPHTRRQTDTRQPEQCEVSAR